MSVFETERPDVTSTSDYKLKVLKETTKARRNNIKEKQNALLKKKSAKEDKKKLDEIDKKDDEKRKKLGLRDKLTAKAAKESANLKLFTLERDLVTENAEKVFNLALFNIIYEACWIDESIKKNTYREMFEAMLDTIKVLESCGIERKRDSQLIQNIKESTMRITQEASKRIVETVKENQDEDYPLDNVKDVDFSLSDDESVDLDADINDLGKEEIVQLVKDKVLTVVQDEKKSAKEKSEAMADLDTQSEPSEDETIDDVEGEKDAEIEGSEVTPDNGAAEESVTITESRFQDLVSRMKKYKLNRKYGGSLFESIMMHSYNTILKESDDDITEKVEDNLEDATAENIEKLEKAKKAATEATKNQILGAALNEAVLTYTILETFNTLGMYDFGPINTNKLKNYYKTVR